MVDSALQVTLLALEVFLVVTKILGHLMGRGQRRCRTREHCSGLSHTSKSYLVQNVTSAEAEKQKLKSSLVVQLLRHQVSLSFTIS